MAHDDDRAGRRHDRWAQLRFAVVGPLLAAPPQAGRLRAALSDLAARTWQHPIHGGPVRFARSTVERWYYQARRAPVDPVAQLRRRLRADAGQHPAMGEPLRQALRAQYAAHRSWSYQLHVDNLRVRVQADPTLGPMPSYATLRRYMQAQGLLRQRRRTARDRPGADRMDAARQPREVRSCEVEYVGGLWHADFHHGSLKVLTAAGTWVTPVLLAFLDDRSRLCCHAQWYLAETAETFVHGLSQALQKRGLPRALLTHNGSQMVAAETREGLPRLGITHGTTLPFSPHQNANRKCGGPRSKGACSPCSKVPPPSSVSTCSMRRRRRGSTWTITALDIANPARRHSRAFSPAPTCCGHVPKPRSSTEQPRAQRRSDGTLSVAASKSRPASRTCRGSPSAMPAGISPRCWSATFGPAT